jgi:hypothetical protein
VTAVRAVVALALAGSAWLLPGIGVPTAPAARALPIVAGPSCPMGQTYVSLRCRSAGTQAPSATAAATPPQTAAVAGLPPTTLLAPGAQPGGPGASSLAGALVPPAPGPAGAEPIVPVSGR